MNQNDSSSWKTCEMKNLKRSCSIQTLTFPLLWARIFVGEIVGQHTSLTWGGTPEEGGGGGCHRQAWWVMLFMHEARGALLLPEVSSGAPDAGTWTWWGTDQTGGTWDWSSSQQGLGHTETGGDTLPWNSLHFGVYQGRKNGEKIAVKRALVFALTGTVCWRVGPGYGGRLQLQSDRNEQVETHVY